jgi:CheY-like chemotaxis protein
MVTSVLIVDDDEGFRRAAAELLEARGYRVVAEEATGEDALVRALELEPDAVLLWRAASSRSSTPTCSTARLCRLRRT